MMRTWRSALRRGMRTMTDDIGAFVPGPRVRIEGRAGGPLAGLTFAAKDLFDVAGVPTGGGNHDWPTGRPVPTRHAWAVQTLLDAGATLIGKTITDEVSLGILGENAFDGTPVNARAPGRVPGGSSSGSAAAVAAGLCDTALGTDTGGSVRVPASFCGLYGIRPTHGRIDVTGMLPQAPTSDTTGWFARDAETFARVSSVMLGEAIPTRLADPPGRGGRRLRLRRRQRRRRPPADGEAPGRADRSEPRGGDGAARPVGVGARPAHAAAGRGLQHLQGLARRAQSALRLLGRQGAGDGLDGAAGRAGLGAADAPGSARRAWRYLLPAGTILCLPTTPFPAPLVGQPLSVLDPLRDRITCLCAQGGHAGHPQVSLPGADG